MSSHARRMAKRQTVLTCAVSTREHPCAQEVRYAATLAFDTCMHGTPPQPVCHQHAWAMQQRPRDRQLQACPSCQTLGHMVVVRITERVEKP